MMMAQRLGLANMAGLQLLTAPWHLFAVLGGSGSVFVFSCGLVLRGLGLGFDV